MNGIRTAARVHLTAPALAIALPWAIMASSFAINILVWGVTDAAQQPNSGTGGLASLYITQTVVYAQAFTYLLPFVMGLSMTRRTFYLGTALFALGQSLVYGVLLYGMSSIERATNGWGVGLPFFGGWWTVDNPVLQIFVFAVPMFAFSVVGMAIGVVYKRFGSVGLYALIIVSVLAIGALVALITWQRAWGTVGAWLSDQPTASLFAGWPLLIGLLVVIAGYFGVRRVVP